MFSEDELIVLLQCVEERADWLAERLHLYNFGKNPYTAESERAEAKQLGLELEEAMDLWRKIDKLVREDKA